MNTHADRRWSQVYSTSRDYIYLYTSAISDILSRLKPDAPQTVLDIGCGTGQVCRDLFHRGYQVLGIDISTEAIRLARASTVYQGNGINFRHMDIEDEQTIDGTFGLIVCKYVYAFINNRDKFLRKVNNLLDVNGTFVLVLPSVESTPQNKQSITVPHNEMIKELAIFSRVETFEINKDVYYLCSLLD